VSEHLFTPEDVAGTLNISLSTLELWCALFGQCLSVRASQPDSARIEEEGRLFSEEDVAVLAGAKQLLSRQVTSSERNGSWSN
jgi:hypothetical protein